MLLFVARVLILTENKSDRVYGGRNEIHLILETKKFRSNFLRKKAPDSNRPDRVLVINNEQEAELSRATKSIK